MIVEPGPDPLLAAARRHAQAEDWATVRSQLADSALARTRPEARLLLAEAELRLGDPRSARPRLLDVVPALERSGDRAALRRAVNLLGASEFELGEIDAAVASFERAMVLATEDGDDLLIARATNNLGAIANVQGSRETALALYQVAIPAYQRIGSLLGLAESFHNMAITFRDMRRLDEADEYERRSMEFGREAGNVRAQAMARVGRAELSILRGDAQMAVAGARMAASEYAAMQDAAGEADANRLAGVALSALSEMQDALACLTRAVELARPSGVALIEAESLEARARLFAAIGQRQDAIEDALSATAIYARLGAQEQMESLERLLEELGRQ